MKHIRQVFKYIYDKIAPNEKTIPMATVLQLYEFLALKNDFFQGPLPVGLYNFLTQNRTELTFDEWDSIPLFLWEFAYGFDAYSQEKSSYPSMYDEFITSLPPDFHLRLLPVVNYT